MVCYLASCLWPGNCTATQQAVHYCANCISKALQGASCCMLFFCCLLLMQPKVLAAETRQVLQ
jgi:hypothetical protein